MEYSEENIISQFFFGGMNRLMILQFHMKEKNNEFLILGWKCFKEIHPPQKKKSKMHPPPQKKTKNRVFFKKLKVLWFFPLIPFPEKTIENHPHQPCRAIPTQIASTEPMRLLRSVGRGLISATVGTAQPNSEVCERIFSGAKMQTPKVLRWL